MILAYVWGYDFSNSAALLLYIQFPNFLTTLFISNYDKK
jgi:hypothetical protein